MHREDKLQDMFELRGEFWRPEKPHERVSGILKCEAGRTELGLLGVFGELGTQEINETEIILGRTDGGPCTLAQAIRIHASWSLGDSKDVAQSVWVANLLFVGANFDQIGDANFTAMEFGFEELDAWLAHAPFKSEVDDKQSQRVFKASYEFPPSIRIPLRSHRGELSLEFSFSRTGDTFRSMTWTQSSAFHFVTDVPRSHGWFLEQLGHLGALLGLFLGEPATPTMVVGVLPGDSPPKVALFFQTVGQMRDRTLHPAEMIFSLDRIGDRLTHVVQKWFERQEDLTAAVGLLFGSLYWTGLPSDFQFLALTQALETFHRRTRGGQYLSEVEYQPIEAALVDALPSSMAPDLRQSMKSRIKYGNEFSQRRPSRSFSTPWVRARNRSHRTKDSWAMW